MGGFFPTSCLVSVVGFGFSERVKNWRFPFQVTKDMIAEASGSDLVLPSEEVEDESFVHVFSVFQRCCVMKRMGSRSKVS